MAKYKIRNFLPKPVKRRLWILATYPRIWFRLNQNYDYDRHRFGKYSSANSLLNWRINRQTWIIGDYHKIEKALALRAPRPGFGVAIVSRLVENLERYLHEYEIDEICVIAINVLNEYAKLTRKIIFP